MEALHQQFDEEKSTLLEQLREANEKVKQLEEHRDELHNKGEGLTKETEDLKKSVDEWTMKHRDLEQESRRKIQELADKHVKFPLRNSSLD